MKTSWLILWFVLCGSIHSCFAVKITSFPDLDTYWDRGRDIIIARCLSIPDKHGKGKLGGLDPVEVEVIRSLKGNCAPCTKTIATFYEMLPGQAYLLYSLGGSTGNIDFLATPELSVVEIPSGVLSTALEGKSPKEQIVAIFSARLQRLQQLTKQLDEERVLLEKATAQKLP